uniref:Uncharacterized protein n=1 Tax=Arion vulgaris TaxID=1028688 RepID=A0A0B7AQK4_9EUPU
MVFFLLRNLEIWLIQKDLEIDQLLADNVGVDDDVYSDGFVQHGEKYGWGFLASASGRVVAKHT